jgi:hypothetical protein
MTIQKTGIEPVLYAPVVLYIPERGKDRRTAAVPLCSTMIDDRPTWLPNERRFGLGFDEIQDLKRRPCGIGFASSFARIDWQNLINFGILPLTFVEPADYDRIDAGDRLRIGNLHRLGDHREGTVENLTRGTEFPVSHDLSPRQVDVVLAGGLTNWVRATHSHRQ